MAKAAASGKREDGGSATPVPAPAPEPPPRSSVTQGIGAILPRLTRPVFRKRSPAGALLMADWAQAVGPAIAAQTMPQRLSGTTLTIAASGPVAMELTHQAAALIGRINAYAGERLVTELRFVQAPVAIPPPPAPRPRSAPQPIDGLPPGELHDALARIAAALKDRDG